MFQSDPKASTSSKLPPAAKDGSGPGGDSGGGSDPPFTEPNGVGQGSVSGGGGGCGGATFKGTIIGGSSGSDPPLTEPSALEQGYVSGVGDTGDGNGGSTFKGIIISGASDPELCSRADPASYRGNSGGGAEGPLLRFHSTPCA